MIFIHYSGLSARFDNGLAILSRHGCRDAVVWSAPQQESHSVSPLRESRLPHPEEEVRVLRLSRRSDAVVRMGQEGAREKDAGDRSHGTPEEGYCQAPGNLCPKGLKASSLRKVRSHRKFCATIGRLIGQGNLLRLVKEVVISRMI
jgi:hypothetical protein